MNRHIPQSHPGAVQVAPAAAMPEIFRGANPGIFTPADFDAVVRIAYDQAGIVLPPGKAMLVYSRLAPLVRETGSGTFATYIRKLEQDETECRRAVCALTTNHTSFFREPHHFQHFAQAIRDGLKGRAMAGQPVRLWSAGCASGEETYSLAMTLLGEGVAEGKALAGKDIAILATDIADHALAAARAAIYPLRSVTTVPLALRQAWLRDEPDGEMVAVAPEATRLVRLRTLNLHGPWPMNRQFDVIFCRNVMIYFDQPTKERLIERFCDQLVPGGILYIGHSERAVGPAADRFEVAGQTIYRKRA